MFVNDTGKVISVSGIDTIPGAQGPVDIKRIMVSFESMDQEKDPETGYRPSVTYSYAFFGPQAQLDIKVGGLIHFAGETKTEKVGRGFKYSTYGDEDRPVYSFSKRTRASIKFWGNGSGGPGQKAAPDTELSEEEIPF